MGRLKKETDEEVAVLTVRVPRALVSNIDRDRKVRAVRVPRNTWILEAVVEKLDRERCGQRNAARRGLNNGKE